MSRIQALPSFNSAIHPDRYKTVLPTFSYPSRANTQIPWSGSSTPLLFSKTTRQITVVNPSVQVLTPNIRFDTSSVPGAFYGVGTLIWHNLTMIVQKIKLIKQKLFGV